MYLPLTTNPEEEFRISILETVYNIRQLRNTLDFWTLDILDADGNVLVYGVKIVAGIRLLQQYVELPFDLLSSNDADPNRSNIDEFKLEIIDKNV